jgi:hypothetical protein
MCELTAKNLWQLEKVGRLHRFMKNSNLLNRLVMRKEKTAKHE